MKQTALERFIRYAKIDTQSREDPAAYPSTAKQFDLLNVLVNELKEIGAQDVAIDTYGYVTATVPSNLPRPTRRPERFPPSDSWPMSTPLPLPAART